MNTQKPKRIDVVVKYFFPVVAGIETNVLETYSVLAQNGWDVTIHTSKDVYLEKDILPDNEIIRGLKIKRYHCGIFGYWPDIDWTNANLVCLHNFDIFPHFQILYYALWKKIIGKKKFALTVTPHGGFNPEWSVFKLAQRIVKYIYTYTFGVMLINLAANGVRAVSEWEKEEMVKKHLLARLIAVIPNGMENEAYADLDVKVGDELKSKIAKLGRYIIQIGRIYSIKNYETTIKALPYIAKDVKFVIAGPIADKNYQTHLENLAKELNVSDRLIFIGVIGGFEKYYLIRQAQLMVHMAIWESFCNVVHEGMSQGLVCIVADNTALPYLIKDRKNGYLISTYDSTALAKKVNYVLDNKESPEMQTIKNLNKEYTYTQTWANVAANMDKFYKKSYEKIR